MSRVSLIGGGRWAGVHRDALQELGLAPAAVLVSSESSAERIRSEWGVPAFTSEEEFFAEPSDAVIICSPNYLHAEHALAALARGRHVLVEKPMALDPEGCRQIIEAGQVAGKVVAVGHEMRVFTLFEEVKRLVTEGALGKPIHLKLDLWRRPYRAGAGGWKADPAKLGSSILEEPIHYLDLARWYLGPVGQVRAWGNSRAGFEGQWQNLEIKLEHDSGARSWVTRSIAAYGHQVTLMLVGEEGALRASWKGSMDVDPNPEVSLTVHSGTETREVPVTGQTGHAFDVPRQARAFLAAINGEGGPAAGAAAGLAAVELCLAAERSLRLGSAAVELPR